MINGHGGRGVIEVRAGAVRLTGHSDAAGRTAEEASGSVLYVENVQIEKCHHILLSFGCG